MKFLLLFNVMLQIYARDPQPKIYFIPAIHGLHKTNPHYSYDSLKSIIKSLHPSVIAVELRREDVNADSSYLKQNYPYEMWMMKYWFPGVKIEGFDWLGDDIEGKPIPLNYWKEISAVKKWERALDQDSLYNIKLSACSSIDSERISLLKVLALKDLLASKDEQLTNDYYACLYHQLHGSIHQRILNFYDLRNVHILSNIKHIINENKGKTIVILTGDDHYQVLKHKFPNDLPFN